MTKTEDKRPTPQERLRLMLTGRPIFRPAYELDAGMTMAWHGVLAPAHAGSEFTVLDALPIVEEAYAMAGDSEWLHARRMAQLTPDAQHAYLDAVEARRELRRQLDALPVTPEACEALRPICAAANATGEGNTSSVWSCTGAASEIRSAYADLRMAINAAKAAAPAEIPAVGARYPLASIAMRLGRALADFGAETSSAITTGAPEDAASMMLGAQRVVNEECLPALARAIGHLQTADEQTAEAARWVSPAGWGLLPECGHLVQAVIATICHASARYAPAANADAAALAAELDGEWQSVDDALGTARASQHA